MGKEVKRNEHEDLLNEIAFLKKQINGYRMANSKLNKKVSSLSRELEKAKAYGAEADELNEQKADVIYKMKKEKAASSHTRLPWYKKIFR